MTAARTSGSLRGGVRCCAMSHVRRVCERGRLKSGARVAGGAQIKKQRRSRVSMSSNRESRTIAQVRPWQELCQQRLRLFVAAERRRQHIPDRVFVSRGLGVQACADGGVMIRNVEEGRVGVVVSQRAVVLPYLVCGCCRRCRRRRRGRGRCRWPCRWSLRCRCRSEAGGSPSPFRRRLFGLASGSLCTPPCICVDTCANGRRGNRAPQGGAGLGKPCIASPRLCFCIPLHAFCIDLLMTWNYPHADTVNLTAARSRHLGSCPLNGMSCPQRSLSHSFGFFSFNTMAYPTHLNTAPRHVLCKHERFLQPYSHFPARPDRSAPCAPGLVQP